MNPVGVFDSGAGGLSIVAAIRASLPQRPIVYYADTAYAPYGPRSDREILARAAACCEELLAQGVEALVVACNTATANAIDELRSRVTVPVVGVEPGLKPAAKATRNGRVGVLATRATLASRRYRELLARVQEQAPLVRFSEAAGEGWVERVEAGDLDSAATQALVHQALQPLLAAGVDTLVLGCTHYPFLRAAIEAQAPGLALIETGPAIARELQRRLAQAQPESRAAAQATALRFLSSGDAERFAELARRLLPLAA